MPETKEVRAAARALAKRKGWVSWHEHREEALSAVYAELGLATRQKSKKGKKRQRQVSCCVCLEEDVLLLTLAPCGHQCVCRGCRAHLGTCPICRAVIVSTVANVYLQ